MKRSIFQNISVSIEKIKKNHPDDAANDIGDPIVNAANP